MDDNNKMSIEIPTRFATNFFTSRSLATTVSLVMTSPRCLLHQHSSAHPVWQLGTDLPETARLDDAPSLEASSRRRDLEIVFPTPGSLDRGILDTRPKARLSLWHEIHILAIQTSQRRSLVRLRWYSTSTFTHVSPADSVQTSAHTLPEGMWGHGRLTHPGHLRWAIKEYRWRVESLTLDPATDVEV